MGKKEKITGARGDWTAKVGLERLAVLHNSWWDIPTKQYFDPMNGADLSGARYKAFTEALENSDKVVIQKDVSKDDFTRNGYVGVFRFTELVFGEDGSVSLKIVERISDPA